MLQTLGNALGCARYHNLMQRYADLIEIAIRSNLADSFGSGVLVPGPGWMFFAPTFHAQQMYARAAGSFALKVEAASDLPRHLQEPDISATLSADGKTLRIYAVNSTAEALPVTFDLSGFEHEVVSGNLIALVDWEKALDSEVMNTRDDPNRVAPAEQQLDVRGKKFQQSFAPLSVSLLELRM
jgi:alpha-L-arabinofuranosidase